MSKLIAVILLLVGVCVAQKINEDVDVKPVPVEQLAKLQAARAKAEAANNELAAIEKQIREEMGDTTWLNFTTASCIQGRILVELRGKFAIITRNSFMVCGNGGITWRAAAQRKG